MKKPETFTLEDPVPVQLGPQVKTVMTAPPVQGALPLLKLDRLDPPTASVRWRCIVHRIGGANAGGTRSSDGPEGPRGRKDRLPG